MAEVYTGRRAGPHGFSKRFAIKRILPQLAVDTRFVEMFCDEARICAALSHPNIVQVVDFGEHDGELFMAMEFVDGVSLARLLRVVAARGERFPIGTTLYIAAEVLRGLEFAHEARDDHGRLLNLVHRDVSPGNILIGREGDVKLTDFGIVLSAFVDRRTYPGELKGKMGYMSPEQVIGEELDARSDLFTLGIVLAEMLLARPLFPGRNELDMLTRMYEADLRVLERYGQDVPPGLQRILRSALARDREKRFQSARAFGTEIRVVADELGLVLNDTQVAPWLAGLGILPSTSGTREVAGSRPPPSRARVPSRAPRRRAAPPRMVAPRREREYLVHGSRGPIGPLSLPAMLELIATGQVRRDTMVSEDGAAYVPVMEVPALAALADRPAFSFAEPPPDRVQWREPVRRPWLLARLFELARQKATGLVLLQGAERHKRVYLEDGVPYFVVSSDREELFGASLVRGGLLDAAEVTQALLLAGERGQRVGEMLVATGQLRPTALLRALIEQLETRFTELGRWQEGEVLFVPDERTTEDRVNGHATGVELAARALREGYDDREVARVLTPHFPQPVTLGGPPVELAELGLTAAQRRALELAPGASSLRALVSELARDAGIRPEETLRGVFVGICAGLLAMPTLDARR